MQGRRLYQLLTYAPEAKPSEDVTQAFLDSFALINTK
jgi:hypothetical protein